MNNELNQSDAKAHPVDTLVINAESTTVKKIWISKNIDRSELRIDWSNDRHQAILLKGDDPKSIARGFEEMARLLHMEIYNKYL